MKFEVHITKLRFFFLLSVLIVVAGVIAVVAYNDQFNNDYTKPLIFGHSADEVNVKLSSGDIKTVQELLKDGVGGGSSVIYCHKSGNNAAQSLLITFTASDCGGVLPDSSYTGVVKTLQVDCGVISFSALNSNQVNGPGVSLYRLSFCGPGNFEVEVVYVKGGGGVGISSPDYYSVEVSQNLNGGVNQNSVTTINKYDLCVLSRVYNQDGSCSVTKNPDNTWVIHSAKANSGVGYNGCEMACYSLS